MVGLKIRKAVGALCLGVGMVTASAATPPLGLIPQAYAESGVIHLSSSTNTKTIKVSKGKPKTIRTDASFSEIVVGDPEIAVVSPLTDRSFYVVGSSSGVTGIALYNEQSELVGMLDVEVGANTHQLNNALKQALPASNVKATTSNGSVVLSGKAKNSVDAAKAQAIAKKFDEDLINTMQVEGSQQVKLEVRFIEAQRSIGKELGVSFGGGKTNGRLLGQTGGLGLTGSTITNALISGSTPFGQVLGNLIAGGADVDVLIQALERKGFARRLAEPNLVALSGDEASFLAGGEFPIPVAQDEGQITIEFKEFGVSLGFRPTVLNNGLINLNIQPEVSAIDTTNSVSFGDSGIQIPGLIVRRASTTVELRDGQSFVMAGLLQSSGLYDVRKFPWLGDIPILGALFRSSAYRKNETDLVIIVTPRLVKPIAPGTEIATPLDSTAPANDVDLFLNGDLEVNRAHLRKLADMRTDVLKSGHVIELE